MRAVGHNPLEFVGGSVSDGFSGRITDPVTGAGLFNPNLDPAERQRLVESRVRQQGYVYQTRS